MTRALVIRALVGRGPAQYAITRPAWGYSAVISDGSVASTRRRLDACARGEHDARKQDPEQEADKRNVEAQCSVASAERAAVAEETPTANPLPIAASTASPLSQPGRAPVLNESFAIAAKKAVATSATGTATKKLTSFSILTTSALICSGRKAPSLPPLCSAQVADKAAQEPDKE
jgi:hypothetical protein